MDRIEASDRSLLENPASSHAATKTPVRWVFGTPVFAGHSEAMASWNGQLEDFLLDLEKRERGIVQSNCGGWQSDKSLHAKRHPGIAALMSAVPAALDRFTIALSGQTFSHLCEIRAWANVNRAHSYNAIHHHVGGFWSGVYYVKVNAAPEVGGQIEFRNPSTSALAASMIKAPPAIRDLFQNQLIVHPAPGTLLLFPSWLEHSVAPHSDTSPRISIAFDVFYRTADFVASNM